jgi:hypothetical protein
LILKYFLNWNQWLWKSNTQPVVEKTPGRQQQKRRSGCLQLILGSKDLHDSVISLWWVHLPAPSLLNLDRYWKR